MTAACTRELTSSLRRMCWTWILTVVSTMPCSRAISLLLAPRAMLRRMSSSRGDRLAMAASMLLTAGAGATGVAAAAPR